MWLLMTAAALSSPTGAQHRGDDEKPDSSATSSTGAATDGKKSFAPGVRIDWKSRMIEVDARVVFRDGPLELFACSPQTREHESVLSVNARPWHIFQAMGLIGLEPGTPVTHNAATDQWHPPRGERIRLAVRYSEGSRLRTVPAERWLRQTESGKTPEGIDWVFAGSRTWSDGRFGADIDGSVACVVDFETALIAVGDLHTADNELLWLEANTAEIPPIGTRCTLLISAGGSGAPPVRAGDAKSPEPGGAPGGGPTGDTPPRPDDES
jgi:hypothetical protein